MSNFKKEMKRSLCFFLIFGPDMLGSKNNSKNFDYFFTLSMLSPPKIFIFENSVILHIQIYRIDTALMRWCSCEQCCPSASVSVSVGIITVFRSKSEHPLRFIFILKLYPVPLLTFFWLISWYQKWCLPHQILKIWIWRGKHHLFC